MELARLLDEARAAPPDRRIEWRDPIASFGERAIATIEPWLAEPAFSAFAIRVIERAGAQGNAVPARLVLRAARRVVPPALQGDLDWAIARLRPDPKAAPARERATTGGSRSRAAERPWYSPIARRRAR